MISVIVTSWGKDKVIDECIDEILSQLYVGDEIIEIKCGISAAHSRNWGASEAQNDLLLFIDGDMIIDKNLSII